MEDLLVFGPDFERKCEKLRFAERLAKVETC